MIRLDDLDEALSIANGTQYGLTASVFTTDINKAFRVAQGIRAGSVWINDSLQAPTEGMFGGFKQSGFGRELGMQAMEGYSEIKSVFFSTD